MVVVESEVAARAQRLLEESSFIDMCWTTNPALPMEVVDGKDSLTRALAGGLVAAGNTLVGERDGFRRSLEEINRLHLLVQGRGEETLIAFDTRDIERAKREHKVANIILFQTGSPIEDDWPNLLPVLYRLGLRILQLTYNERNLIGCGCHEPHDEGLTAYGRQVVKALNALGIIIDLSHVGHVTALEVARLSKSPVIYSHSNAAALCPHARNISDDEIAAVRDTGGVIGVVAWAPLCRPPDSSGQPGLDQFLDQIDYMLEHAGPDHVGIGTDINENIPALTTPFPFQLQYGPILGSRRHEISTGSDGGDPAASRVAGFERIEDIINVIAGMMARGYTDELIHKILGENFLRVARQVWD